MAENGKREKNKVKDTSKPAGKVGDFRQIRPGTARATIVEMTGKGSGASIEAVAQAIDTTPGHVLAHLHCINRDCAYGYEVKNGRVTMSFPGSRTWRDAIRPEKQDKPEKSARAQASA